MQENTPSIIPLADTSQPSIPQRWPHPEMPSPTEPNKSWTNSRSVATQMTAEKAGNSENGPTRILTLRPLRNGSGLHGLFLRFSLVLLSRRRRIMPARVCMRLG
jgi:hypothetical protein